MSIQGYLLSGNRFKTAKKLTDAARQENGGKADQLFKEAFNNFAEISESYSKYPDALHRWGLALLQQAQTKSADKAIKIFEEAITKFSFAETIKPNHLGAAMDGGVALMGLANVKAVNLDNELYVKARESFKNAEEIQPGSASYNLACMYALQKKSDACLEALEIARDNGLVPDEEDIINDDDLNNVKKLSWFDGFIQSLSEVKEEEEEEIDPYKKQKNKS